MNAARAMQARAEVKMELTINAYQISDEAESVNLAKRAVIDAGLQPRVRIICGGTDAAHYNEKGVETVVIGMGVKGEHTKEEHITVMDMEKGVRIIQHILGALSG